MSFFDELGLRAAEQLEASVGPFVALASYKRLFGGPPEIKARAVVGALRCALALDDDREIESAISVVGSLPGKPEPSTIGFSVELLLRGKPELANHLAQAELERGGAPIAAYVKARSLEVTLGKAMDACALWGDVVERAAKASDARVHTHAASRFIGAWLARVRREERAVLPRTHLAEVAEKASLDGAAPEEKLLLLRGKLLSASNFQRASALSSLEEIARTSEHPTRAMAVTIAARHFDEMPFQLHSIEIDRVRAALKRLPDGEAKIRTQARLEASIALVAAMKETGTDRAAKVDAALDGVARASDLARAALARIRAAEHGANAQGGGLGTGAFDRATDHALGALVALKKSNDAVAAEELGRVRDLLSPDVAVPISAWTAAATALEGESRARSAAIDLVAVAFARTTSLPPPPLVGLALLVARAGSSAVAAVVLEEASRFKEAEARAASADTKRRLAYDALARGDRDAAWAELKNARELFASVR